MLSPRLLLYQAVPIRTVGAARRAVGAGMWLRADFGVSLRSQQFDQLGGQAHALSSLPACRSESSKQVAPGHEDVVQTLQGLHWWAEVPPQVQRQLQALLRQLQRGWRFHPAPEAVKALARLSVRKHVCWSVWAGLPDIRVRPSCAEASTSPSCQDRASG